MNRADVQMLNSSLDQLGESLLKNRMLDQKQREDAEQKQFRTQQLGIEQQRANIDTQRMGAEQTHFDTMDQREKDRNTTQQQVLQSQQAQAGIKQLQSAYAQISNDYRNGVIDKGEANRRAKALVENIRNAPDMMLKQTPFAAMLDSDADIFTGNPSKPTLQPAAVATDKAAQDLMDQADELDDEDPDGASALRERAQLLRDHLKKNPPKTPFLRKSVSTKAGNTTTTFNGPADQVDQAVTAPGVKIKMVLDPKTNRLVPVRVNPTPTPGQ